MDEQRLDDQQEPIYSSSESIQDVAQKTFWERWTIVTREGQGNLLTAWHDDNGYIYKEDLALNNLHESIYYKTQPYQLLHKLEM